MSALGHVEHVHSGARLVGARAQLPELRSRFARESVEAHGAEVRVLGPVERRAAVLRDRSETRLLLAGAAQGPPGVPADIEIEDFVPTLAQNEFLLAFAPSARTVVVSINNSFLAHGTDYTVDGSTVTLLGGLAYALDPLDRVQIRYSRG